MTAMGQWAWADETPKSRLSDAELGSTMLSTKQGRRLIIWGLILFAIFCAAWIKAPHALSIGFVPMAGIVGLYLYIYHPSLYIGYNWWVWLLAACARRFIEIKSGYMVTSPILLAPYIASLPMAFTLLRNFPRLLRRHLFPFALVFAALCYAFIVGIVSTGLAAACFGLLTWGTPVLIGFHIAAQWDIYPAVRAVLRRVILTSVLFMGVYGVYQFVRPLPWDQFWMYAAQIRELGAPEPMQFRVFSTMNSPAPFAVVMLASLIVVLSQRSTIAWLAMGAGATALLLTTVRTAWLACVLGFLIYSWYVPWRSISRIVVPLVMLGTIVIGVTAFTPLGDVIVKRFESFGTLHDDVSLHERANLYHEMTNRIMNSPLGTGMGGTGSAATMSEGTSMQNFDSGLLDILFSLGWFGALVYVIGLCMLVSFAMHTRDVRSDYFDLALRAGALAVLSILPSFNSLVNVDGIVFWGFLGLCIGRYFFVEQLQEEDENRERMMALAMAATQTAGAA